MSASDAFLHLSVTIWDLLSPRFVQNLIYSVQHMLTLLSAEINISSNISLASHNGLDFSGPLDGADIQIGWDLDNLAYWSENKLANIENVQTGDQSIVPSSSDTKALNSLGQVDIIDNRRYWSQWRAFQEVVSCN